MKYAVSKWIQKIHIVPEEKKSQHIKINLILSIKKSKNTYSCMNIEVSRRAYPRRKRVIE
jgi:hypothetical protein